jgi:Mrp family chromosome partitioning ATPase
LELVAVGDRGDGLPDLISPANLHRVVAELRASVDVVVVDGGGVLTAAGALALADVSDAVLLVVRAGRTTRAQVALARHELGTRDGLAVAAVLEDAPRRPRGSAWPTRRDRLAPAPPGRTASTT